VRNITKKNKWYKNKKMSSSSYFSQTYVDLAAAVCKALQRRALTLSQINSLLATAGVAPVDEATLELGVQRGWLLGQPEGLYQVNPWMDRFNPMNRLIGSWVPKLIDTSMSQELPASYVPGFGLTSSIRLAPKNSGMSLANLYALPSVENSRIGIINPNFITNAPY
jgi:hypothetical protein